MTRRQWIALALGATLILATARPTLHAQTATAPGPSTTTATPTTTSSNSTSNSGGGGGGGGGTTTSSTVSAAVGGGLVTNVATVAATSQTPSATSMPSNANVFGTSYVNYFTLGLPQTYQNKFGAENYSGNLTGTFGKFIYVPNPANVSTAVPTVSQQGSGFGTFGQPRAPVYTTAFAESVPLIRPEMGWVQTEVRDAIAGSSMLKNRATIQTSMKGAVVFLNGVVGSETERRTAEGMVRMTPGVQDVQNNLAIDPSRK